MLCCLLLPSAADYTTPTQGGGINPGQINGFSTNLLVCPDNAYATAIQASFQSSIAGITPDYGLQALKLLSCSNVNLPTIRYLLGGTWADVSATGYTAVTITWKNAINGVMLRRGDRSVTSFWSWGGTPGSKPGDIPGSNATTLHCPKGMLVTALKVVLPYHNSTSGKVFGSAWYIGLTCRYGE